MRSRGPDFHEYVSGRCIIITPAVGCRLSAGCKEGKGSDVPISSGKNQVCTNLCVSTDGYKGDLKVSNLQQLTDQIYHIVKSYNQDKHLTMMSGLSNSKLTESQFAHLIGKTKLYNYVDKDFKSKLDEINNC